MVTSCPLRLLRSHFLSLCGRLCAVALLSAIPVSQAVALEPGAHQPRVIVVLSGGGARGAGHVGVLRALEELNVPIHGIVGTSMGAVVGGLYAAGYSPDQLDRIIARMDWADMLDDNPGRRPFRFRRKAEEENFLITRRAGIDSGGIKLPRGIVEGQKLKAFFNRSVLHTADLPSFDELNVPFRGVATDIATGKAVVLDKGSLADALFASMAIPTFFSPMKLNGKLLVDGGVSDNLPIDVAFAMGADFVIAVDLSSPLKPASELPNLLDITDQLTSIMTRSNTETQIADLRNRGDSSGLLIEAELNGISALDFKRAYQAISVCYAATMSHRQKLLTLSVAEPRYRTGNMKLPIDRISVEEISLETDSRTNTSLLESRLAIKPGEVAVNGIEGDLNRLYGMDLFSQVSYLYQDGKLIIKPRKREWGPYYLQFGIRLDSNFKGSNNYSLGMAFTATEFNESSAEWRTEVAFGEQPLLFSEFFQPIGPQGRWFLAPSIKLDAFEFGRFESGEEIAHYQLRRGTAALELGRELGTTGELRAGIRRSSATLDLLVGDTSVNPTTAADEGYLFTQWRYDSLDNLAFPREGYKAQLLWTLSRESLGAIDDFQSFTLDASKAISHQNHTWLNSFSASSVTEGRAPLHQQFFAGGFLNLSGLNTRELTGQHGLVLRTLYYYRWSDNPLLPSYFGMSLEGGNVWSERGDVNLSDLLLAGSLFVGFETLLGPVYIGTGVTEHGDGSVYVQLGKPF